jgi:ABC-type phosphate transport system permease subunit
MATREQALTTSELVARRLRGGGTDWRSAVLEGLLLLTLLVSLGVLFVLLADTIAKAMPIFLDRPAEFLTSPLSARAERAGIVQAVIG